MFTKYLRPAVFAAALLSVPVVAGPASAGTYRLTVSTAAMEIDGRTVEKMTINGGVPGPTLHLKEGEDATITVANETDEETSVHWHGILLPGIMDGVPGFNGFMGIAPGASYTYTFRIRQSGTYWYHSHSGTQDQSVLGAIVIEPEKPSPVLADRDYVVLLGDITPEDSNQVLRNLKADPGYYNYSKRTLLDFFSDVRSEGFGPTLKNRAEWGEMRMDPTDLADVTGYSFLVNGKTADGNETFLFQPGEKVRLRLINGSAMTLFDVRIPGAKMTVVAADGNDVRPVAVDEIRMGVAERYDVIVEPSGDGPYAVFAEPIDRTGYALATLATENGQKAPVPERRPRTLLAMDDMGMMHGGHEGHAMDTPQDAEGMHDMHDMHNMHEGHDMSGGAHHEGAGAPGEMNHEGMNHEGMDHGGSKPMEQHMDHEGMGHGGNPSMEQQMNHEGMDHGGGHPMEHEMDGKGHGHDGDHSGMAPPAGSSTLAQPSGWAAGFPEGAEVLAYESLQARSARSDNRPPERTVEMRLTGNMERYAWSLNGDRFQEAEPVRVRYGERVRLVFSNETMMAHPMHLHGMFFELENGTGPYRPLKDTVIVPPGKSVSVILTAREIGSWPLHCHLLYHMASGMMTAFVVEPPETPEARITPDGAELPLTLTHGSGHVGGHGSHGMQGGI
ncbi:multicopper oxidase domain-containing protein [Parvibaculum sp.]|uniref:multicopper oxidase domain-containing protein n=1 Tax=Parvibaculum sp. TaxID=2024848 RepID=UPI001B24A0B9|nr:multicopper oxidase domain-containing protein [Parvibaculum sp.]MBO6633921.1 multicopper oxidase domain-containing protein [Parvibaculum sp.]MBO6678282.1 multicopper oxidase domain-containing protein [Parvibaculum sp.]MBO6684503.1 multicopper oxidase domain-containing protein [Parvibaculum sp.]